ncbi:MAG: hypothetical protein AB1Z63_10965 [Candidatus Limnocylindrales bacterium]
MDARLTALLSRALDPEASAPSLPLFHSGRWLARDADPLAQVAAAFLIAACGRSHPDLGPSLALLESPPPAAAASAAVYRESLDRIEVELGEAFERDPELAATWDAAAAALAAATTADEVAEAIWRALFPQAVGIRHHENSQVSALRHRRTIEVEALAADPISDPAREVLFTSNVLLTVPDGSTDVDALPYPADLRAAIRAAANEPQRYWFDHPIQIGVEPAANELLYGLRGLDAAVDDEPEPAHITCLLSVSVTHEGLAHIARQYVEAELARAGGLEHVDVVIVTEDETRRLVDEVLLPALDEPSEEVAAGLRRVVGVDGRYGRHYSFLKAVAALWQVAVSHDVRATFKIDLDQVFPQDVLVAETGKTMFEHLRNPLWGATARTHDGEALELGMLAGALVNERDIGLGLFTPDVPIPERLPALDEHVFFSALPQSISTRAEMMERYDGAALDGRTRALERVHVTGGTNGIRVDALRSHRPFTPTWVGRAEDQAYLLSTLGQAGPRLAYAHAAGLIMRHDKEAFAGQSMEAARIGKLIGDDVRILIFSAYVAALARSGLEPTELHDLLDPFTGCFASATPRTLVALRVALRTLRLFGSGQEDDAREYATLATARVEEALATDGDPRMVELALAEERRAWDAYYEALEALETGDGTLAARARDIIDDCRVATG